MTFDVVCKDMPPLLAKPGSLVYNRAPFARHNVCQYPSPILERNLKSYLAQMFVTPYSSDELYPSELHVNQNPGGEEFGLAKWVARDDNIDNEDIVLWPCECPFASNI